MADLAHRNLEGEVMDDPSLAAAEHLRALRGLSRINRLSGCGRSLWRAMDNHVGIDSKRELRILDIATGSGDVLLDLWRRARRWNRSVEFCGVDISETAIDAANTRAGDAGAKIEFRRLDVLRDPLPAGYDIIMCSLFLHHLGDRQAVELLHSMREAAESAVIVSDLRRCAAGLAAAQVGCRLLSRSEVVRTDGPRSVRAAFTVEEAMRMASDAGMDGSIISRRWPWRWLLIWNKMQNVEP